MLALVTHSLDRLMNINFHEYSCQWLSRRVQDLCEWLAAQAVPEVFQ